LPYHLHFEVKNCCLRSIRFGHLKIKFKKIMNIKNDKLGINAVIGTKKNLLKVKYGFIYDIIKIYKLGS